MDLEVVGILRASNVARAQATCLRCECDELVRSMGSQVIAMKDGASERRLVQTTSLHIALHRVAISKISCQQARSLRSDFI